jgi:Flp pilus assembly pilin Flp
MKIAQKLWADEAGIVVSTELILIVLILVLGLIAGMASLRDAVAQELADLGEAINALDGSYEFTGNVYTAEDAGAVTTRGPATAYDDAPDANNDQQGAGSAQEGLVLDTHDDDYVNSGEDGLG